MNLRDMLLDRWIEHGGGSRPLTNTLRFSDLGVQGIVLTLRYVFDWETKEVENMHFRLSHPEFNHLIAELEAKGYSKIENENDTQKLLLELKVIESHIFLKLCGKCNSELGNPTNYQMLEFERLMGFEV